MKRHERHVLFVRLDRLANLAQLPARLAFDVQDAQRSFNHFHEGVLFVVFNSQLAVERRDFNCVTMNPRSRRRDLEIDSLRVVAAQVELFSFHSATIFTHTQQHLRRAITTQANDRLDVQS